MIILIPRYLIDLHDHINNILYDINCREAVNETIMTARPRLSCG